MATISTVRILVLAVPLMAMAAPMTAQTTSRPATIGMSATVRPNLKLQPRVYALENEVVTARVVAEGPDGFRVHAQVKGRGKAILQIPVWLSANIKSFTVSASSTDAARGTVRMVSAQNENISLLSSYKPLQASSTFALGLPAAGRRSAAGTLNGTIEIALAELPDSENKVFSIHFNISQNGSRQ